MKLTSIQLHPESAGSSYDIDLSFRDPKRENPYLVRAVVGLDADEIVPRYYGVSGNQSLKYYSMVLERRDVIIRIELNPSFATNESYSDLRDAMYKLISVTRTGLIRIRFKNESETVAVLNGFIRKLEAPTSGKVGEVQLTIECEDPMLKAPTETLVDLTGFDPGYTILDDQESTAPHGFKFTMNMTGPLDTLLIQDPTDLSWHFQVTPNGGFLANDELWFSSEVKDKYLYIQRAEQRIHLAEAIRFSSVWPIMFPGENHFTFASSSLMNWASIEYFRTYWGV